MNWIIAGLGNPGEEYTGTRHNAGRELLMQIEKKNGQKNKLFGKKALCVYPNVYMNNSGGALKKLVTSKKAAEGLVVLHDDLDLPLSKVKVSFGSGSGGHRGVESIIKAIKTQDFVRVRIGISPTTPSGKLKKPESKKIVDFVLGKFKPTEEVTLKKVQKKVEEALKLLLTEDRAQAMTKVNAG